MSQSVQRKSWPIARWLLIAIFLFLAFLELLVYFGKAPSWIITILMWNGNAGGFASLFASVAIALLLHVPEDVSGLIRNQSDGLWGMVILVFGVIGFYAIWLSVRALGLYFRNYVLEPSKEIRYLPSDVFSLIGFVLAANLAFTIMRQLSTVGEKKPDGITSRNGKLIKELVSTLVQALVISALVLAPRYNESSLITELGGSVYYFIALLLSLVVAIVLLLFARARYLSEESAR